MAITIRAQLLEERLEAAVRIAEAASPLPESWTSRVEHIAGCPSETYIAAFGVALLAKASDPRIDALTIKASAGENGYSMRGVARVLAGRARHYGYHLGVTGPEPLNNQPWFSNDRVDRIARIRPDVTPYHQAFVRYLRDLNRADADEALVALAAFLRLRLAVGHKPTLRVVIANPGGSLADVIDTAEGFIRLDPEGGKRGQAVVAAIFDCVSDEVQAGAINNPRAFDVQVSRDGTPILAIEVKQKPVGADEVGHLADAAASAGIDKAVYAALAPNQPLLDRDDLVGRAASEQGVLLVVCTNLRQTADAALIGSATTARETAMRLPGLIATRLEALRVSEAARVHWAGLYLRGA